MDMEATLARDVEATLAAPLAAVFDHLAAPERLGDWLIAVMGVAADGTGHPDIGAEFALTLRADGVAVAATGDVVAYEPPWQVAYRLCVGPRQHVVRITCAAHDGGTRVRVAQGGRGRPLAVAVTGLTPAR